LISQIVKPAQVLVVAGTHGNERNAPWLLDHWQREPRSAPRTELLLEWRLGNPAARAACRRYLERDLNRSFDPALLQATGPVPLEVERALVRRWRITTVLARQSGGTTEQLWRSICDSDGPSLLLLRRPEDPAGVERHDATALLAILAGWMPTADDGAESLSPDVGSPGP
jgi:succinylglutamate desuccinylase